MAFLFEELTSVDIVLAGKAEVDEFGAVGNGLVEHPLCCKHLTSHLDGVNVGGVELNLLA